MLRPISALSFAAAAAQDYDVVVYDATSSGVMAAYAAAKQSAKVALVCASYPACFEEGGKIVGGMSAGGLGQTDLGSHSEIIGGFALEFYRRNRAHYGSKVESVWQGEGVLSSTLDSNGNSCRLPADECDATFNLEPSVAQSIYRGFLEEVGVEVIYGQQVQSIQKQAVVESSRLAPDKFVKYAGKNCKGSDLERFFPGTAATCKDHCQGLDGCAGFVRVNSGSEYAGQCFFRGTLQQPQLYSEDDRDCYALKLPTCSDFTCPDGLFPKPGQASVPCTGDCDNATCCDAGGGATIKSLTLTGGDILSANVFIDASYEGDLFAAAGASYRIGREGPSEYSETLAGRQSGSKSNTMNKVVNPFVNDAALPFVQAEGLGKPGEGDDLIQAYNFRMCVTKNETIRAPFPKPANYNPEDWELLRRYLSACQNAAGDSLSGPNGCQIGFPSCNTQAVPGGKYDMNNCGGISSDFIGQNREYPEASYEKRREIWQAHRDYIEGLLWTMANDPNVSESVRTQMEPWGLCADEFVGLGHFPPAMYVREARRLQGDRVFTQNTPGDGAVGELSIGLGNYNFDSHNTQRFVCKSKAECFNSGPGGPIDGPYVWVEGDVQVGNPIYEIPYWVLLPKRSEVANLLVAGCPSATHIGMSTLRMEPQFMMLGHAAGVAAKLAVESGSAVHDVDLSELQRRLVADGQIISKSAFMSVQV